MIRNLLLSAALVLVPVAAFSAVEHWFVPASTSPTAEVASASNGLGDLSSLTAIVTDVQAIAATGDMTAAEKRVTDFETAWDDAEATMRPKDPAAWGQVDDAADAAFKALRASKPDPAKVDAALAHLQDILDAPSPKANAGKAGVMMVSGIAVTDGTGHPLACEMMLTDISNGLAAAPANADLAQVSTLRDKATERCNADDDARANTFSAQALALLTKGN